MKKLSLLLLGLIAPAAYGAEGAFTWIGAIQKSLGTHVPGHVITLILVCVLISVAGLIYTSKAKSSSNVIIPDRGLTFRNICEAYGQFIMDQCKAVIGEKEGPKYFGFVATTFLVILISNLIGLVPGFLPPTEYLSTTLALGAFSFIYYNIKGCKELGTMNYLAHFCGPLWYMAILIFPIEILSNFIRPLSLALRLQGNMSGDHIVLSVFSGLAPAIIPIIFMILGILVSCIQAYVFTVLSMVYISLATAHHDHDDAHAH